MGGKAPRGAVGAAAPGGSSLSSSDGGAARVSPLGLALGPALPPEGVTPAGLQQQVQRLLDDAPLGTGGGLNSPPARALKRTSAGRPPN